MEPETNRFPKMLIGVLGGDPFPCIKSVMSLYSQKNMNTVVVSLGASKSCLADLEICEELGSPLFVCPVTESGHKQWNEVGAILKLHARTEETSQYSFSEHADTKWILSKNFRIQDSLPWWNTGTMDISGEIVKTVKAFDWVTSICSTMKINGDVRIDILKIDMPHDLERGALSSIIDAGFRPGLILIKWNKMPDTDIPTSILAGHLHNCGYHLVMTESNKFVYYYTDNDLYMTCSWENTLYQNPIITEIINKIKYSKTPIEGPNARGPAPVSTNSQTNTIVES
jgi:hypothetical protein